MTSELPGHLGSGKPHLSTSSQLSVNVQKPIVLVDAGGDSTLAHQTAETLFSEADSRDQKIDQLFALISLMNEKLGKMDDSLKTLQQKIDSPSSNHHQPPGTPCLEADQLKLIKRAVDSVVTNLIKHILKKMVEDLEAGHNTLDQ